MSRHRHFRAPALLVVMLAALLVFAAGASAETRTGESNASVPGAVSPEATLLKSSASYDTTTGTVGFEFTTAAEPRAEDEGGKPSETVADLALFSATSGCSFGALESRLYSPPLLLIESHYSEPTAAVAIVATTLENLPPFSIPVGKTVSGTTTTLALALPEITNQGFNCAIVLTREEKGESLMAFPIAAPVIPPETPVSPANPESPTAPSAPAAPAAPSAPAAVPAPPPAALSIAKAKPLKLKVGKSKTVKVKVTNTGATATAQGSLRVKPAKGVLVTPETQKLPVLVPGASWTVSVRVQLTEKAKPKSMLSVTGTASGLTAKGSLVVKLKE
jgi:hypothetical protein